MRLAHRGQHVSDSDGRINGRPGLVYLDRVFERQTRVAWSCDPMVFGMERQGGGWGSVV